MRKQIQQVCSGVWGRAPTSSIWDKTCKGYPDALLAKVYLFFTH